MELFVGLAGVVLGLGAFIFSIWQFSRQKRMERLSFLANVIIDEDIPRESRQPFYDEYVSLGGNGTVNKFWLRGVEKK